MPEASTPGYERFGLYGNPFHELDSDNLQDVELRHVAQPIDHELQALKEDVVTRKAKASALFVGSMGVGKTERLRLAAGEARRLNLKHVLLQAPQRADQFPVLLATALEEATRPKALARFISTPKWFSNLARVRKPGRKGIDPEEAGRILADTLNANAPAFVLVNDLHNLGTGPDATPALQLLQSLWTHAAPGVLLLVSCYPEYFAWLEKTQAPLLSRFHRVVHMPGLSDAEAAQLLAKRMAYARLVDDLDPIFPFDVAAVAELNVRARQNPRDLLRVADRCLDVGVRNRAYHVDVEQVREALGAALLAPLVPEGPVSAPANPVSAANGATNHVSAVPSVTNPDATDSLPGRVSMVARLRAAREGALAGSSNGAGALQSTVAPPKPSQGRSRAKAGQES